MNNTNIKDLSKFSIIFLVVVTSLGYFVDAADLVIASLIRTPAI